MSTAALARITEDDMQPVFRALADPTRRQILRDLAYEPQSIAAVAARFEISRPAVVKHLNILREGGLLEVETRGRERLNTLAPEGLKSASEWLSFFDAFWDDKLAKLKHAVETDHAQTSRRKKRLTEDHQDALPQGAARTRLEIPDDRRRPLAMVSRRPA